MTCLNSYTLWLQLRDTNCYMAAVGREHSGEQNWTNMAGSNVTAQFHLSYYSAARSIASSPLLA